MGDGAVVGTQMCHHGGDNDIRKSKCVVIKLDKV